MTTDGRRRDTATADGLAVALVLGLALTVAVSIAGATPVASAQSGQATGGTTLQVALPEAPDGLAGYQLTLELETGTVTGASYPDVYQPTTEPAIGGDGRSVALEAADVSNAVQAGDGEVVLATVTVADLAGEQPSVRITDAEIDADGGDRIDPETVTVTVEGSDRTDVRTGVDSGGESAGGGTAGGGETTGADGPGFGILVAVGSLAGIGILVRRR